MEVKSIHLSVKAVSRSSGRSATGAAAYRAGAEIADERTGLVHDYTRKQGVEHCELFLPDAAPEWAQDRAALWNAAELAETRKNSTVAREFELGLPIELNADQRRELVRSFAREISERHGVAVDLAIHAPHRDGDERNNHAHLLITTRQLTTDGLTVKTRELDQKQSGEVDRWRERWAEVQNNELERMGSNVRYDHRSNKARGIEQEPELKQGPNVTAMERRAEKDAARKGVEYAPVTAVGQHNAVIRERARLRQIIDRGTAWLKSHGLDVGRAVQSTASRIQALADRLRGQGPAVAQPEKTETERRIQERYDKLQEQIRDRPKDRERDRDRGGPER